MTPDESSIKRTLEHTNNRIERLLRELENAFESKLNLEQSLSHHKNRDHHETDRAKKPTRTPIRNGKAKS